MVKYMEVLNCLKFSCTIYGIKFGGGGGTVGCLLWVFCCLIIRFCLILSFHMSPVNTFVVIFTLYFLYPVVGIVHSNGYSAL